MGLRLRKALPESSLLQGGLKIGGSIGGFRHGGQGGLVVFDLLLQMLKAQSQHNRGANACDPDNASKHEWYQQSRHGNYRGAIEGPAPSFCARLMDVLSFSRA